MHFLKEGMKCAHVLFLRWYSYYWQSRPFKQKDIIKFCNSKSIAFADMTLGSHSFRMYMRRFKHCLGDYKMKSLVFDLIGLCAVCLAIFVAWKKVSGLDSMTVLNFFLHTDKEDSVNPFFEDARRPRRNYISDRSFRDSLLRREFNMSEVRGS